MTLRIAEIFGPTIQGEGVLIGEPTVFVRAAAAVTIGAAGVTACMR